VLGGAPQAATAALEWATWGPPSGNTSIGMFSNGQQVTLAAGTVVAALDLSGITVNSSTMFGIGDVKQAGVYYRLELRDAAQNVLPLSGVVVTPYNLVYTGGLIADFNLVFHPKVIAPTRPCSSNLQRVPGRNCRRLTR
jgi:hypothetical protein